MEYKQLFSKWSEEVLTNSTVIGRVWLTVLFFFRVLVLMVGANIFQLDSSRPVVCNVGQVGCVEACEHAIFPVIPLRFWSAQLIFASTPTLLYLAYVMHVMYGERMHLNKTDVKAGRTVRRSVACSYFAQLLAKISLEVAFIVMQRDIYRFAKGVWYGCSANPCRFQVDCYISRATEMKVFSFLMLGVSGVSVVLNVLEGLLVLIKLRRQSQKRGHSCSTEVNAEQLTNNEAEAYNLKEINY